MPDTDRDERIFLALGEIKGSLNGLSSSMVQHAADTNRRFVEHSDTLRQHDKRIGVSEQWRAKAIGMALAVSAIGTAVINWALSTWPKGS